MYMCSVMACYAVDRSVRAGCGAESTEFWGTHTPPAPGTHAMPVEESEQVGPHFLNYRGVRSYE